MKRSSKLITAITVGSLTAAYTAAPASAEPPAFCKPDGPFYVAETCEAWKRGAAQAGDPTAPATTTPSSSTGSGGITDWIDQHIALLIGIGLAVFVIAVWRSMAREKAEEKATADAAALARGRAIAQNADTEQAARSPEDLQRYSTFGWAVPWQQGTAFGNLVNRDGGTGRVHAAWVEACELARLGHWDENGKFTPAATVVNVNGYDDDTGDLELSVSTADYTVGETQLNKVLEHLTRTARVETANDFTRTALRDWHVTRLSMIPRQMQQAPEPAQDAAAPDPTAGWEW
ncbi:hypothetical protein BKG79_22305 [Mycobacteroides chelonae]|uniref:hypothetical protein n=1 Tax=Mycobacteroides chelonae TaxID=1774 RepID=UPI0008A9A1A1|nr:hypothetical protein [Mycobacteroides chelonae]OHU33341.1 hypothetical protein BKG79_22305 [Mycobacteroides chelonae]